MRELEQRKLTKANETRQQAIRTYKLITAFRRGTKDRYAYYLLCVGWAAICAVASGTTTILLVLVKPDMNAIPGVLAAILLLLAVAFFVTALVLMVIPYDIQRKLENFDAYKAEFEKQWGVVEESDVQRVSRSGHST